MRTRRSKAEGVFEGCISARVHIGPGRRQVGPACVLVCGRIAKRLKLARLRHHNHRVCWHSIFPETHYSLSLSSHDTRWELPLRLIATGDLGHGPQLKLDNSESLFLNVRTLTHKNTTMLVNKPPMLSALLRWSILHQLSF